MPCHGCYLLLQQLLPHSLAVGYGHCLDFLLPLLCVLDPLEEPIAALAVVPQLAAQLVQLALAQVRLGEDSLPALQQLLDSLPVAVQVHIAFAVAPDHPLVDILGLAQVSLQCAEEGLMPLCLRAQPLRQTRARVSPGPGSPQLPSGTVLP